MDKFVFKQKDIATDKGTASDTQAELGMAGLAGATFRTFYGPHQNIFREAPVARRAEEAHDIDRLNSHHHDLVIYFWAVYFNGIVSSAPQAPVADESQPAVPVAGNSSSPTGGLANGTAMIFQFVWNSIASLGRALDGPKQYIIKTQQ